MKNKSVLFRTLAALSLASASSVQGASLAAQCSQSTLLTVTMAAPNGSGSLTCPQFNVALGTLTGARIYLPSYGVALPGAYFTVDNPTSTAITRAAYTLDTVGITVVENLPDGQLPGGAFPLANNQTSTTILGNDSATVSIPSISAALASPLGVALNPSSFSTITGNGNFIVPISVNSEDVLAMNNGAPLTLADYSISFYITPNPLNFAGQGQLSSNIVYTYIPAVSTSAPEPSTTCLAICGLGIAAIWPRSNKRA